MGPSEPKINIGICDDDCSDYVDPSSLVTCLGRPVCFEVSFMAKSLKQQIGRLNVAKKSKAKRGAPARKKKGMRVKKRKKPAPKPVPPVQPLGPMGA